MGLVIVIKYIKITALLVFFYILLFGFFTKKNLKNELDFFSQNQSLFHLVLQHHAKLSFSNIGMINSLDFKSEWPLLYEHGFRSILIISDDCFIILRNIGAMMSGYEIAHCSEEVLLSFTQQDSDRHIVRNLDDKWFLIRVYR